MVSDIRIKSYIFPEVSGNNTGSQITRYTDYAINGELLRVDTNSNYTGSIIIKQSGAIPYPIGGFINSTVTSGTNKFETFSFSNTTGSFVTNSILQVTVSGLASGTNAKVGFIEVLYR